MYSTRKNLLIGFHGCDESVCTQLLLQPDSILKSKKPYDWLGHGIYFWENNFERAKQWAHDKAKKGEIEKPAVLGAVLSLDYCFDLLDNQYTKMLKEYYELMKVSYQSVGKDMPQNKDITHDFHKDKILRNLDCAVIEFMHQTISEGIKKEKNNSGFSYLKEFDSTRGVFTEGGPAFEGAGIQLKSHIQICIRNTNCIKGFFMPRNLKI